MKDKTLIIIPAFNEEKNLPELIERLKSCCLEEVVLIINDGSTDKTMQVAEERGILVVRHAFNMGVGASFQTGCVFALTKGYDYIVRMDGDGQHDPGYIVKMIDSLKNNEADIVIGSRFLGYSEFKSSFIRRIGIAIIATLLSLITKKKVTDPTSGFCAMNRKAYEFFARNCVEDYPEPEILLHHKDFRIKEVPISMVKRNYGESSITFLNSIYYMYKVLFSLLVNIFRKEAR